MAGDSKAPEDYSTNPITVRARQRKMTLSGAKKIEDDARTADYKAMIYARKVVMAKPGYKSASDSQQSTMLENAMRETMEKRYEPSSSVALEHKIWSAFLSLPLVTSQDLKSRGGLNTFVQCRH